MAKRVRRDEELSGRAQIASRLKEVFSEVQTGFEAQRDRSDKNLDYWDAYNCVLGSRQFYNGNAQIFLPIIRNAVNARKTRFVNQIFPQSQRYIEVTTENGDIPHATMALLEHYIRICRLRTQVVPPLVVAGDAEGQYSVYVGWQTYDQFLVSRKEKPLKVGGLEFEDIETITTIEEEKVTVGKPEVFVISDSDLLVLPATVDSIEDALQCGGSVTVMRRWTRQSIKQRIKDGEIEADAGEKLVKALTNVDKMSEQLRKKQADAAGIQLDDNDIPYALIYETWTMLKVGGDMRLCRAYFGGEAGTLGCKLSPYWCDKVPVISGPVNKVPGVFKGRAPIADVIDMQILANDAVNEGADTAHFSAMPIIMTDPEKNPRVGSMVLGLASIWETNPNDTQFAQFPALWKDSFTIVASCKSEVFQTLGVNPAMISSSGGEKRTAAEIANEQQVDIITTADAVTAIEETILTPLAQRFAEYDHQFRDEPMTIRMFGEMGMRANMQEVEPIQMDRRYEYRWFGVEAARNAQQVQQQIAMLNVLSNIPPNLYPGYRLDMVPLITQIAENSFGPRLAPLIFVDIKAQLSVDPLMENEMLEHGFECEVHEADDDMQHMQAHMAAMRDEGDPHGTFRAHMMLHQKQMTAKAQAAGPQQMMAGPEPQQLLAGPGGPPGGAGAPQPGGQVEGPRMMKQAPGAIHPDEMVAAGAVPMPR